MIISMYIKIFSVKSMAFYIIIKNRSTMYHLIFRKGGNYEINVLNIELNAVYQQYIALKISRKIGFSGKTIALFSLYNTNFRRLYRLVLFMRGDRAVKSACYTRKIQLVFSEKPIFLSTI